MRLMRHAGRVTTRIDVALLPSEALCIESDCYVVIDVLRATTTIATLFERGISDLIAVNDVARAKEVAERDGRLLLGEINGLAPEGFDYGNSPVDASRIEGGDRGAVLFTTNGTAALCSLAGRADVVAGALANAQAVADFVQHYDRVVLVCAGIAGGNRFGLDDFAAAGVLVERIRQRSPGCEPGDAAALALTATGYERWRGPDLPSGGSVTERLIAGSEHGQITASIGLGADIEFSVRADTSRAVPMVTGCGDGWAMLVDATKIRD
jgi:2-phosphosulfolactate phosphatase